MPNTHKILVVEDDPELRGALTDQLSLYKEYEAVATENGSKGVQVAKARKIDLVILDVGLPDIRRPADFRQTRKCSAPSPRYQQGPLITRGARCLPRGGADLPSARNSRCSPPWATTCVLFLNSAIVAGCRDGRRAAGEIVPQFPCKRD
jgi:hypothetical protein